MIQLLLSFVCGFAIGIVCADLFGYWGLIPAVIGGGMAGHLIERAGDVVVGGRWK